MKVILVGEQHNMASGPNLLLNILKTLKNKNIKCLIGLEMTPFDNIGGLYMDKLLTEMNSIKNPSPDLQQMRLRKFFLEAAFKMFTTFPADTDKGKNDKTLRDLAIAQNIYDKSSDETIDIVVMLVGNVHLPGIIESIRQLDAINNKQQATDILVYATDDAQIKKHFPDIEPCIINNNGFFYTPQTTALAIEKLESFIQDLKPRQTDTPSMDIRSE